MQVIVQWIPLTLYLIELVIKIVAVGTIPRNRRPSSSLAWLLLIVVTPVLGLLLFFLIGSPFVRGRRERIQLEANAAITERTADLPELPTESELPSGVDSLVRLNRRLGSMPIMSGTSHGLFGDYDASIAAMTAAVREARSRVHVEIYIMAWDHTTDAFFTALAEAVERGVHVRLLYDHIGSRKYPGFRRMNKRMTEAGIEWHQMMPIHPLKGRWRRPDLRNHRKLLVVDGEVAFMGSQNMIDASYLIRKNIKIGRRWHDLNIKLSGQIVSSLDAVFALDWYTETGESLVHLIKPPETYPPGDQDLQLLPSGPGYLTIPNLRLFTALVHRAQRRLSLTSPYFVPDDSLLEAITTASYRGVDVELFVSEQADQFMVQHAQASYYEELLTAGVRIFLYPKPTVLHAKFFTVDDIVGVIGSSNMDYRSFGLDYEISLMGTDPGFVADLHRISDEYRAVCHELTAEEWAHRSWRRRYVDNVMRLLSALQ
ncbi:cardiolipin synthase [Microlunatus ginsengisoli]|uniref:Cardiolipin synthase n=1 Tax=Microlunatus ginsengisoli TaxID=363863 RepID=A0ABP6ZQ12_9ACTN